jgi:catechol 2,3-dioxygenase-like lactoylglutathione lyase family enzyme
MFSHVQVGARNLDRMVAFYDRVLVHVGLERQPVEADGGPAGVIWQRPGQRWPQFVVQLPFNGLPATWGNGWQVSFAAPSQEAVRRAWETAMAEGGSDEGKPGLRPQYNADYYGAYCRDPEGNKLCFVHAADLP